MRWRIAFVAHLFLPAIAVGLTSCAIVDQYSSHAVAYNIEAEQAQEQQLVLNIVRASLRRPMQFTSVTTITGSQSASATAGLTAPFGSHSTANTGTFGASASGGPTFTVPVLDTQDFYRGMLQGIPGELVDLLIHAGYSPELIFNLLIEKIEMTKLVDKDDKEDKDKKGKDKEGKKECPANAHWTECEFYVANDPGSDTRIELFHSLIRYLVALGLSTQPRDDPSKPTPQGATSDNDTAKSGGNGGNTKEKNNSGGSNPLPVPYVFCFAPKDKLLAERVLYKESFCGYYKPAKSKPSKVSKGSTATATATATGTAPATATATATAAPPAPPVAEAHANPPAPAPVAAAAVPAAPLATPGTATATGTAPATATATPTAAPPAPPVAEAHANPPAAAPAPAGPPAAGGPSKNTERSQTLSSANTATKAEIKRTAELTLKLSPEIADDMLCVMGSYDGGGYSHGKDNVFDKFKANFRNDKGVKVELKFYMRSTMGLLNFLGQVVARDLNTEMSRPEYANKPRRIWIGDTATYRNRSAAVDPFDPHKASGVNNPDPATLVEVPSPKVGPCRLYFDWNNFVNIHHYRETLFYDNLFVLDQGAPRPEGSYLSVDYFGRRYSIPNDPQVAGWTTQVLEISKQLIAVSTSATQLPQTSVISVISP